MLQSIHSSTKGEKNKKLLAEAQQMLADSKWKIDGIKMSILKEKQQIIALESEKETNGSTDLQKGTYNKTYSLEQRIEDLNHHIDVETRVLEGGKNMMRHLVMAQDKKAINEVWMFMFNTYFMKQPDLYYFETIKMTSQA